MRFLLISALIASALAGSSPSKTESTEKAETAPSTLDLGWVKTEGSQGVENEKERDLAIIDSEQWVDDDQWNVESWDDVPIDSAAPVSHDVDPVVPRKVRKNGGKRRIPVELIPETELIIVATDPVSTEEEKEEHDLFLEDELIDPMQSNKEFITILRDFRL
jgi:hypothetical protein